MAYLTIPADIEAAVADLIARAQAAGHTNSHHDHALTAIARVSLETVIAAHLRAYAEMKAALDAQTSGA